LAALTSTERCGWQLAAGADVDEQWGNDHAYFPCDDASTDIMLFKKLFLSDAYGFHVLSVWRESDKKKPDSIG
jgi:hypothetical protein